MTCTSVYRSHDLNYCQGDATIHVGRMVDGYAFGYTTPVPNTPGYYPAGSLSVLLTDMATGRKVTIIADDGELPTIQFEPGAWEATSGQMYLLQVVGRSDDGGLTELKFYPYEYDPATSGYVLSATEVDGVYVKFVKVFGADGSVETTSEGWITLKQ